MGVNFAQSIRVTFTIFELKWINDKMDHGCEWRLRFGGLELGVG